MKSRGILLFDIDGVIRDVGSSYRMAIKETVNQYCNYRPSNQEIDGLKSEGSWNNDWDASLELIKRNSKNKDSLIFPPKRKDIIQTFNSFYFGGDPNGGSERWKGFINNESLLVTKELFQKLNSKRILWGFVSGAEHSSAKFVLEKRLGLLEPPLIAMGEAPEKPDPSGLIQLSEKLTGQALGSETPLISYIGDTVADVKTVIKARQKVPDQKFISLAVAPPHLHETRQAKSRAIYEGRLQEAGADIILKSTLEIEDYFEFITNK